MDKKVDKRLQKALQKGLAEKKKKEKKAADDRAAEKSAHEKALKKYLPKAKAWVKTNLFQEIAKQEANGHTTLSLYKYTDNIPTELIFDLVKKIDGLSISYSEKVLWEDSDYGKLTGDVYTISWQSTDPNLNRNY